MASARLAVRLSKALLSAGIALTCTLAVLGNAVDPQANLDFTRHVLAMDTLPPGSTIRSRAITDPTLQSAAFALIVAAEALIALLLWIGALRMVRRLGAPPAAYAAAKGWAIAGLTLGFLLWQTGFMGLGGEWFGMWMSKDWNGQEDAFRFAMLVLGVLIYVALPEPEA